MKNTTGRPRISWDQYGLLLARTVATRSEDPYVQVGCVGFRQDHSIVGTGYNGAPTGVEIDWSDRDKRRSQVVHAEANLLKYSQPGEIYYLYCTLLPCSGCFEKLQKHGVREIIYEDVYERDSSTLDSSPTWGIVCRQFKLWPPKRVQSVNVKK